MRVNFRKCLMMLAVLLFSLAVLAQNRPIQYKGHINAGVSLGDNKTNVLIQTIHGARLNTWFAGIGGGLDSYFQQSLPLFLDIRKNILNTASTPFVYADAGVNFVAETKGQAFSRGTSLNRRPGGYYELGAGYSIDLKTTAINLTAGYSYKGYKEQNYGIRHAPNMEPEENVLLETKLYHLRRISFKIGFEF